MAPITSISMMATKALESGPFPKAAIAKLINTTLKKPAIVQPSPNMMKAVLLRQQAAMLKNIALPTRMACQAASIGAYHATDMMTRTTAMMMKAGENWYLIAVQC